VIWRLAQNRRMTSGNIHGDVRPLGSVPCNREACEVFQNRGCVVMVLARRICLSPHIPEELTDSA
jgi:hypothetical protein